MICLFWGWLVVGVGMRIAGYPVAHWQRAPEWVIDRLGRPTWSCAETANGGE